MYKTYRLCLLCNEPVLTHSFHESVPCDVFRVDFAKEIDTRRRFAANHVATCTTCTTCTDNVLYVADGSDNMTDVPACSVNLFDFSACPVNVFDATACSEDSAAGPDNSFDLLASLTCMIDVVPDSGDSSFSVVACPTCTFDVVTCPGIGFDMSTCLDGAFDTAAGSDGAFDNAAGPDGAFDDAAGPDDAFDDAAGPDDAFDDAAGPDDAIDVVACPEVGFVIESHTRVASTRTSFPGVLGHHDETDKTSRLTF
jgi:hypothetical protein